MAVHLIMFRYNQVGESSTEMSRAIREGEDFLGCQFFTDSGSYVEEFKQYLVCYTDLIAITGFSFIAKSGRYL